MAAVDPLTAGLNLGTTLIERLFQDPQARDAARLQLFDMASKGDLAELAGRSGIVLAEAQSEGWLTRSWRPLLMLTFGALIVARWLGYSAANITQDEYMALWEIIKIGLGGYVVGRSFEKTAPAIAEILKK